MFFSSAGLVPEPACQVAQEGAHKKGPRPTGPQRPPPILFR